MKEIIIKSMRLLNFKGMRDLNVDFNQSVTNIFGRNGSGKTTVFDAFTWLLFGKDSSDRKQFDIKTLDENGDIIPQLPHEVSAVISVNGQDITLTRRFTEKWVKRAGKAEREFTGNIEERFFNEVPCSKADYEQRIAEICDENVFKAITSPTYFTSLKSDAQKTMLHRMAGSVSDAEVAAGNSDFEQLLSWLTGKTLEDFKKEIGAKKQRINAELIGLPGRIDEKKRDIANADAEDWSAIEAELKQKRESRADIEKQLYDAKEAARAKRQARAEIENQARALQQRIFERKHKVTEEVMRDFYEAKNRVSELMHERHNLQSEIASLQQTVAQYQREITACDSKRKAMLEEYSNLMTQQKAIVSEVLQIDEAQFVCPTCKRPLDIDDIEKKEAELQKNFDADKAQRLQRITNVIEQNKRDGRGNNERKQYYQQQIDEAQAKIQKAQQRIAEIEASEAYNQTLQQPDATAALEADEELKSLNAEMAQVNAKLESEDAQQTEDTSDLKDGHIALTEAIEELVKVLSNRTKAEEDRKRVTELEEQMQSLNIELAELESKEFIIEEFSKARSAAIEARINGMFSRVRFRWIAVAVNGAEKETCEATIDGVPYSSLNHAGQIIAGLDIINAICKHESICAPIFIDNAESINDIIPMQSQIINLIVSRDSKLRVEANK